MKRDYSSLTAMRNAKRFAIITPQMVLDLLKKENPHTGFPEFTSFLLSDKHNVPKTSNVIKDINYKGGKCDLHFVKKDGGLTNVLYLVKK